MQRSGTESLSLCLSLSLCSHADWLVVLLVCPMSKRRTVRSDIRADSQRQQARRSGGAALEREPGGEKKMVIEPTPPGMAPDANIPHAPQSKLNLIGLAGTSGGAGRWREGGKQGQIKGTRLEQGQI